MLPHESWFLRRSECSHHSDSLQAGNFNPVSQTSHGAFLNNKLSSCYHVPHSPHAFQPRPYTEAVVPVPFNQKKNISGMERKNEKPAAWHFRPHIEVLNILGIQYNKAICKPNQIKALCASAGSKNASVSSPLVPLQTLCRPLAHLWHTHGPVPCTAAFGGASPQRGSIQPLAKATPKMTKGVRRPRRAM